MILILLVVFGSGRFLFAQHKNFEILGPGGGGAMFNATVSPHNPNDVLVSSDMTGSYISHDGGHSWRMFNLRGVVRFFAFDPRHARTIYASTGPLWRSTDAGETWHLLWPHPGTVREIRMNSDHSDEQIVAAPDPLGEITALAIDPKIPTRSLWQRQETERLLYSRPSTRVCPGRKKPIYLRNGITVQLVKVLQTLSAGNRYLRPRGRL